MPSTDLASLLDRLRSWDAQRQGFPGEHWLAFAAGLYLLARPRRSTAARLASLVAGAGLVARSLSGRDGAIARLEERARERADAGYVEVAAPWPYDRRVRVSTPHRVSRRTAGAARDPAVPA